MKTPPKGLSRRNFFKWLSATGIGGAILGWQTNTALAQEKTSKGTAAQMKVPKRNFGNSGLQLPILSLGGIFDTGQNHVMMHQAVKGASPIGTPPHAITAGAARTVSVNISIGSLNIAIKFFW